MAGKLPPSFPFSTQMHPDLFVTLIFSAAKIQLFANALVPIDNHWSSQAQYFSHRDPLHMMTARKSVESENDDERPIRRYDSPFFPDESEQPTIPTALIILNTPISKSANGDLSSALNVLWRKSSFRVCADGGANRLFDVSAGNASDETIFDTNYLPDLITGDLDSLFPNVREYYEKRGVPIIKVEDQDYHDLDVSSPDCSLNVLFYYAHVQNLQKALMAVERWIENLDSTITQSTTTVKTKVLIYGGFGGRFDQEMGCMNALYVWGRKHMFRHTSIALYGEETCAFLLLAEPATNEIRISFPDGHCVSKLNGSDEVVGEGPSCGLIPLGGRCDAVVTSGLKWNLNGEVPLEFGGLVSSSNRVMDAVVTVQTSSPMIFTTEMIKR